VLRILVVHQSAELYGSDRSLLELLAGIDRSRFSLIVCLPEHGPLEDALRAKGLEVHVVPLVKVSRRLFSPLGLLGLPLDFLRSARALGRVVQKRKIDLVYTNTLAVLGGALWAKLNGIPHVWHVREIILEPRAVSRFFQIVANRFSRLLICNSEQTRAWISAAHPDKSVTVWNGVEVASEEIHSAESRTRAREKLGLRPNLPLIVMVGRVNAWKGQDLLMDALDRFDGSGALPFQGVFVGSAPPGQPEFVEQLVQRIAVSPHADKIQLRTFTDAVTDYYRAADILVVPSRKPEPFGRVAIEAMSLGVPVAAASHGGLVEIVDHNVTGILFPPNDAAALADALQTLLRDCALRERLGEAGRCRQKALFSASAYREGVVSAFLSAASSDTSAGASAAEPR
jgi:glycosyltransferase involved in cell wall biosynthesis